MSLQFEIVWINKKQHPYYLIARQLVPGQYFSLLEMPFLNGVKLKPVLTSPSAKDSSGLPAFDLFIFYLVDGKEIKKFTKGMIAELRAGE